MCQRLKVLNCVGGCYVVFAIVTAMAAFEASDTSASDQSQVVAHSGQETVWRSERLPNAEGNPRRDIWLTIWTTRNCSWCELQKEEIPALEKAGYNVIVRRAPAPRWVKGFPATVVTKDSPTGRVLKRIVGYKSLAEFDRILGITWQPKEEEEEEDEVPDYNITGLHMTSLIVWVSGNDASEKQKDEVNKLRKLGLPVNIYFVDVDNPKRNFIKTTPTVILVDNHGNSRVVAVWRGFVSAQEILDALP